MSATHSRRRYRPTEAKYKGGADEMYVTYDLEQETRGGKTAVYPKVKRVYIAGDVRDWKAGEVRKKSGKTVHGVQIDYEQTRGGYHRGGYTARRGATTYQVKPADIPPTSRHFSLVVEVPQDARNVRFQGRQLPEHYRAALQDVR